ncbi:MAG: DUF349 domain-containing protein [Bacteroidaceae bacterium]|nr:DUF349 domain-containing protein [Bacteroidaceae bacterium]
MTETYDPQANANQQEPVVEGNALPQSEATEEQAVNAADTQEIQQNKSEGMQTCEDIVARIKVLAEDPLNAPKEELDQLKQAFYKLHRAAVDAAREAHIAAGGTIEEFKADTTQEEAYKAAMSVIKEKRAEQLREEERIREENALRKEAILDRIQTMVENADKEQASYNDFKALQQEWKEVGEVSATKQTDLWKRYQQLTERFYDILKLNIEFREYDFKKNLENKVRLCESAERLAEEEDVVSAFHQLQKLHQEYRETGPVAKELREDIWNRFKNASTLVNKRHQQHFEELKKKEQENLEKKTAICEAVEAIELDKLTGYSLWNEKTQEVIALQEEWKTIGFAPQKMNTKIFERFRAACDNFFNQKGEFFKGMRDGLTENLEKKLSLCEQAEALQNSTDWKGTADKLAALQREWKTIGPVAKKQSDIVWKRFITACDAFYEKRKEAGSTQRSVEHENLAKKKEVIAALSAINPEDISEADASKMHDLIKEWNSIGHVPFRDKDKIYKQYKAIIDSLFDALHKNEASKRVARFKDSIKEGMNVNRERERLLRAYDNLCNEIKTYGNNLGFLTSSSKSGNSLVAEMQRKMEKLKADAEIILKKIKALNEEE